MPDLAIPMPPQGVGRILAMKRGLLGRCPACGEGRLFGKFLKVKDCCDVCGTEMHHHRADDMPPYIVMFIVGHLVGYCVLVSETRFEIPLAVQVVLWPLMALALCLILLQPVKGAIVGLQYSLGMHGFAGARARQGEGIARHGKAASEGHDSANDI